VTIALLLGMFRAEVSFKKFRELEVSIDYLCW